jgi:ankyrin repeat protein
VRRVVDLLLDARADVNARDENGATPLISAWTYGEDAAPVLIARGADVNVQDNRHGDTALMVCRNPNVTRMLLEAGADPYARNSDNKTALDLARMRDRGGDVVAVLERWMAAHPERKAK